MEIHTEQEVSKLLGQKAIYREKEVIKIVGKSRSSIWRDEKAGRFPKRVRIGIRACGWLRSDLEAWLQSLKNRD
ncbi:MAG: AlpA family phage regulatory protein [Deltaproteobacteria bacterium]|nr:AlpA family phage regulatory protein [Deltaproteobacteria bacterium]